MVTSEFSNANGPDLGSVRPQVDLATVISTDQLRQRPGRPPNHAAENRALVELAREMAHAPDNVLQALAETALNLCQAGSAGISLLDSDGTHFYWPTVVGALAALVGGGTPRSFGPCGTVLDTNAAVMMTHPERHFDYLAAVTPAIEEVLLIPFYVDGVAVGTIWVVHHDERHRFDSEDLRVVTNLCSLAGLSYAVTRDTARRADVQEALRRRTAQFETLLAEAPLGVFLIDRDLRILEINPTALPAFGNMPDLIGKDLDEMVHILRPKEIADDVIRRFRHTLDSGEPYATPERTEERRDRDVTEYYEWQINRILLPEGSFGVVCYFRDISAKVFADIERAESTERLRFMAESMPQKIFTATPSGDVDYLNRRWMEFTGLQFEQVCNWGWLQFIHQDDVEENIRRWKHSVETGEVFQLEHRFLRHDGEHRWHLSRAEPMRDAHGDITMWIGSSTDIHDQRLLAEEREGLLDRERSARAEAELANRAKSHFLKSISHELRTPLNAIGGYVELIQIGIQGPVTPEQQTSLARIRASGRHLLRLIDGLLGVARIEAARDEYTLRDLSLATTFDSIRPMVEPQIAERRLALTVRIAPDLRVHGDRDKIQQILLNLLSNAIKFTPSGGSITVDTARREGVDAVFVRVEDTGVGLDEYRQREIFTPFHSNRDAMNPDGVGLGLTLSLEYARGMGGDLRVRSEVGKGSTFTLSLPVAQPDGAPVSTVAS